MDRPGPPRTPATPARRRPRVEACRGLDDGTHSRRSGAPGGEGRAGTGPPRPRPRGEACRPLLGPTRRARSHPAPPAAGIPRAPPAARVRPYVRAHPARLARSSHRRRGCGARYRHPRHLLPPLRLAAGTADRGPPGGTCTRPALPPRRSPPARTSAPGSSPVRHSSPPRPRPGAAHADAGAGALRGKRLRAERGGEEQHGRGRRPARRREGRAAIRESGGGWAGGGRRVRPRATRQNAERVLAAVVPALRSGGRSRSARSGDARPPAGGIQLAPPPLPTRTRRRRHGRLPEIRIEGVTRDVWSCLWRRARELSLGRARLRRGRWSTGTRRRSGAGTRRPGCC